MKKISPCFWLIIATTFILSSADEYYPQTPIIFQTFSTHSKKVPKQHIVAFCSAYKHRNNTVVYENLHKYTAEQLQHYFSAHHYSEKELLEQPLLYLSDEFIKL